MLMPNPRNVLLGAVILTLAGATGYLLARFVEQGPSIQSADFRNAATAEVRTAGGQLVLRGTFMLVEEEDDDIERKAALAPTPDGEVLGEAEVEFATEMPVEQEVEFAARGLVAGATYILVVDGREIGSVAADGRGRIAIELDVPLPGATSR